MNYWPSFTSRTVRQANALGKHVRKLLNHQRDLLAPKAIEELHTALRQLDQAKANPADKAALDKQMENLEAAGNKWLKPYPHPTWRENIEVLLVALTVAMGVRTFFLQPFKIPTGSMQPTLYGVTSDPLAPDFRIPTGLQRVRQWFEGVSYLRITANQDGIFQGAEPPFRFLIFNIYQKLHFAGKVRWIWFPPDYGNQPLEMRARVPPGKPFRQGEDIIKLRVQAGDHLFVDRVTYNFRKPRRGEIIVFETKGIMGLPQDQFYIKRLVALPGERVQIGDDRHLVIDGKRLDAATPHFENVYSFDPHKRPEDSHYSGHLNQKVADGYDMPGPVAPLFPDGSAVYTVGEHAYMVMGDNTVNSLDSRSWGDFSATNVIGRSWFVYWPITERFGWGCVVE